MFLGMIVISDNLKTGKCENILLSNFLTEVLGFKSLNPKILQDASAVLRLMDRGHFYFPVIIEGQERVYKLKPITLWDQIIDKEESYSNSYKPVEYKDFRDLIYSFTFEIHADLYNAKNSNQFIKFNPEIVKTNQKKFPFALPIYIYIKTRFRLPDQLKDGYIKASVESLFKRLNIDVNDPNYSRYYQEIKKCIEHLKNKNFLGNKTNIVSEEDNGSREEVLGRIFLFYPNNDDLEDYKRIKSISDSYKKIAEEKSSFTRDEVKKIWEDSHLTLGEFAKQTGIGKDVLSKYLNGKTANLSQKVVKKLNLYLQNRKND